MNIIDLATKTLQLAIQTSVAGVKSAADTINTNVGEPASTASSETSANSHAKLNYLLTKSSVKSIQRGNSVITNANTTASITISDINPLKSLVFLDGVYGASGSSTSAPYVKSLSVNSLTVERQNNPSNTTNFSWQVIEFY